MCRKNLRQCADLYRGSGPAGAPRKPCGLPPHGLAVRQRTHDLFCADRSRRPAAAPAPARCSRVGVRLRPGDVRFMPAGLPVVRPAATYRTYYRPVATVTYMPVVGRRSLQRLHGDHLSSHASLELSGRLCPSARGPVQRLFDILQRMLVMRRVMRLFVMRDELWRLLLVQCRRLQHLCHVGRMLVVRVEAQSPTYATPIPAPATIGAPSAVPSLPSEGPARTFAPGSPAAPISPSAPGATNGNPASSGASYRIPSSSGEGSRAVAPPRIQGVPPIQDGPQLNPTPDAHPEPENRVTSRPVVPATYFQLLGSPPASVPAQWISEPQPVDDGGCRHAEN